MEAVMFFWHRAVPGAGGGYLMISLCPFLAAR